MPISRRRTPEKGRDYAKPRQSIRSKDFKAGDRVRHKKEKTLGTVEYAQSYGYVTVLWDDGERSVTHRDHVIHTANVAAPHLPNGEAKEYRDKPHFLTAAGRKQYKNISAQGWQFLMTFVYPSGKVAQHFTNDGKTLVMDSAGHIEMIYPVGSEVFDIHKDRKVKQGYGSEPNPGKAFFYHGSYKSQILARRKSAEIPGSFIEERAGRFYVLQPKKISSAAMNPRVKRIPLSKIAIKLAKELMKYGFSKAEASNLAHIEDEMTGIPSVKEATKRIVTKVTHTSVGGKRTNPTPKGAVKIYGRCLRIEAVKLVKHTYGGKPTKAGQRYFHDFTAKNAMIYGLPDGSILIKAK